MGPLQTPAFSWWLPHQTKAPCPGWPADTRVAGSPCPRVDVAGRGTGPSPLRTASAVRSPRLTVTRAQDGPLCALVLSSPREEDCISTCFTGRQGLRQKDGQRVSGAQAS